MSGRVVVIGDALIDNLLFVERLPLAGEDVKVLDSVKTQGGSAANTALSLCSLGIGTSLISSVGDDEDGVFLLERLKKGGVDVSLVSTKGRTGFTVTMIDNSGERTMMSFRGASADVSEVTKSVEECLKGAVLMLVSGYMLQDDAQAEFALSLTRLARDFGVKTAYDPCPVVGNVDIDRLKRMLSNTDVLLPNEAEFEYIRKIAGEIETGYAAVKLGGRGSRLYYNGQEYYEPAKTIEAVDTTGAGDAFNAGFIAAMLKGFEPQEWLRKGNEAAAGVVVKRGAV